MPQRIKRILVYTHNSIGLGHAYRTLAVITGIRHWRPDIEFLILSGSSIPTIFFSQGIEVIKLPSMKLDIDGEEPLMRPRYLQSMDLESLFDFRQKIIMNSFDFFRPDVLMIEHHMTGQMNELIPLLMKKWMRKRKRAEFALAYICRGILKQNSFLTIPIPNPRHGIESIDLNDLFDFVYVLEDREVVDIRDEYLGHSKRMEYKISYLGRITNKTYGELPRREQVLRRLGLSEKKIILIALGRNRRVGDIVRRLLALFSRQQIHHGYQVVIVLDPYLDRQKAKELRNDPVGEGVRFFPFVPDLVDLIAHSELVISRAGYNTVNEILLTGTKALLIPEAHGGGEQELRCQRLCSDHVVVLREDDLEHADLGTTIQDLLNNSFDPLPLRFDKYAIGNSIIEDFESWMTSRRGEKEGSF